MAEIAGYLKPGSEPFMIRWKLLIQLASVTPGIVIVMGVVVQKGLL
jgi:hypothetical protein